MQKPDILRQQDVTLRPRRADGYSLSELAFDLNPAQPNIRGLANIRIAIWVQGGVNPPVMKNVILGEYDGNGFQAFEPDEKNPSKPGKHFEYLSIDAKHVASPEDFE